MVEMRAVYIGDKHCELTHSPSGTQIETDAPKDNGGKGAAFSPTDLMGASYASCALTTMAIIAEREGIPFGKSSAKVIKEMSSSPRKVARLPIEITMPLGLKPEHRKRLEEIARNCPVALSLHPEIERSIQFIYQD